MMKTQSWEGS